MDGAQGGNFVKKEYYTHVLILFFCKLNKGYIDVFIFSIFLTTFFDTNRRSFLHFCFQKNKYRQHFSFVK